MNTHAGADGDLDLVTTARRLAEDISGLATDLEAVRAEHAGLRREYEALCTAVTAITRLLDGRTATARSARMNAELRLDAERRTAHRDGVSVPLSPREFDLLRFLLDNPGRDLSVETVFERAWALPYRGDSRTLRVHVRSVRRKLASLGRPGIRIASVSGVGYRADPW